MSDQFTFAPVTSQHKDTVKSWLAAPHVAEYFHSQGLANTLENLELYCQGIRHNGLYSFDQWIAYYKKQPIGFFISSVLDGPQDDNDDYEKYYQHDQTTYCIDMLIGDTNYLGKGLASSMLNAFIADKLHDADVLLMDPEVRNGRAIAVYEKSGFRQLSQFTPSFNPVPHIMMRLIKRDT